MLNAPPGMYAFLLFSHTQLWPLTMRGLVFGILGVVQEKEWRSGTMPRLDTIHVIPLAARNATPGPP